MRIYLRILYTKPNRTLMSQSPLWVQALNIAEEKWTEWTHSHSEPESILFWGLTHEQISWHDYREWAKNHYGLCVLDDSYFQLEDMLGEELHSTIDPQLCRPWLQPLYCWEDVLYIACLEPIDIPSDKKVVPILCSPWQLESRWEKIKDKVDTPKDPDSLPDLPDGIVIDPNPPKVQLNLGQKEEAQPVIPTSVTLTKDESPMHLTHFNFEAQGPQPLPETYDFGPISLGDAPAELHPSLKEKEIISWLFQQLQPFFEMMWWVDLQDERVVVKWWYPEKKFDPTLLRVDTHTPSFFRIVKKTKLPYHGHIVDSAAHQTFFSAFGGGTLPAHVTALPVILQSNLREIFIGSTDQKHQDPQLLVKVEKILEKALQVLESQRKPKQKTA